MKIPVTLITGFLGSGKTTLVNALLAQTNEKIALIINEFGDISIDDRLITKETEATIQLASGSICCAVKDDLMQVLASLLSAGNRFDRIVIETTGLADPIPLIEAFAKKPMLYGQYETPHVITVIDAFHIADQLQSHEEAVPQIAVADVILINKIDLVPDVELVENLLRRINPLARIFTSQHSVVPIEDLLANVDGDSIEATDTDTSIAPADSDSETHGKHVHSSNIETCVLREARPLDLQKVGLFIAEQILLNAENMTRYKGILNIDGMSERFVFQGLHTQFSNKKDRSWNADEERVSEVVIIGRGLNKEELQNAFSACAA